MNGKVVVVTGANSGIGRATAADLARRGATVALHARSREKGEAARDAIIEETGNDRVRLHLGDFASLESVASLADDLLSTYERIDVLVNNAGVVLSRNERTEDDVEATFQVNHLSPFLLTKRLLPRLEETARNSAFGAAPTRIVNVSSEAHRMSTALKLDALEDLVAPRSYGGLAIYGRSKLCNILHVHALAARLNAAEVTANALHPGVVGTSFGADGDTRLMGFAVKFIRPFLLTPEKGARTSIHLATSPDVSTTTATYFKSSRPKRARALATDATLAEALYAYSERLIAERLPAERLPAES